MFSSFRSVCKFNEDVKEETCKQHRGQANIRDLFTRSKYNICLNYSEMNRSKNNCLASRQVYLSSVQLFHLPKIKGRLRTDYRQHVITIMHLSLQQVHEILWLVCLFRTNHYHYVFNSKKRYSGARFWPFLPLVCHNFLIYYPILTYLVSKLLFLQYVFRNM